MWNERIDAVPDSCFRRLESLLADVAPASGKAPIKLHVGDPEHPIPGFVMEIINEHAARFGDYAPTGGTDEFRQAAVGWLERRYGLPTGMIREQGQVLPVAGLRESMFLVAVAVLPSARTGQRPGIAIPNPFYHSYLGAALALGADPVFVTASPRTGFLPDFDALEETVLDGLSAAYLCTPSNPEGAVADLDYLCRVIELARRHGFALLVDECYAEIYGDSPPPGVLEACARLGGDTSNVLAFHSLSKRSNVPGLRSGFVAGDPELIRRFRSVRDYGGTAMPLPVQAASAALWRDDEHAASSRELYRPKFDAAERIFGNWKGFYRPQGGMFLWLRVGDCEAATVKLWRDAAVRVMPGRYMSSETADGEFPGAGYVRISLVPDLETTVEGLERIAATLGNSAASVALE